MSLSNSFNELWFFNMLKYIIFENQPRHRVYRKFRNPTVLVGGAPHDANISQHSHCHPLPALLFHTNTSCVTIVQVILGPPRCGDQQQWNAVAEEARSETAFLASLPPSESPSLSLICCLSSDFLRVPKVLDMDVANCKNVATLCAKLSKFCFFLLYYM